MSIAPSLMNAPFALAFARLSRAKAWLHIQDFELDAALKLGLLPGGKWLAKLAGWLEHFLLTSFDKVSSISESMLTHLTEKGLPPDKIMLLPNWVDTGQIYPLTDGRNPLRASLGLAPEQVTILYAGTMGKKQGLESLLDVAGHLQGQSQIQLILCGDGVVRAELEEAARGLPNIRFLPVQPKERLNQLLNLADIHVLPQKAGAADLVMPSKLTGMLASGKAIIATAEPNTELGQVVSHVGEMVHPEDSLALTEAILSLVNDPPKRKHMGKLGRQYACQHLDKELVLTKFNNVLEVFMNTI